jgi:hypothetical protein
LFESAVSPLEFQANLSGLPVSVAGYWKSFHEVRTLSRVLMCFKP